jgi:hypothetical protein
VVAILRTAAGMGALQQFTNDKRLLYAAIERVRWSPSHGTLYTFAPVAMNPGASLQPTRTPKLFDKDGPLDTNDVFDFSSTFGARGAATESPESFRQEVFTIGTLGALGFVVRGLRELPGRKSVVLFSDALRIYDREQRVTRVRQALDNLTDLANRAAKVIKSSSRRPRARWPSGGASFTNRRKACAISPTAPAAFFRATTTTSTVASSAPCRINRLIT